MPALYHNGASGLSFADGHAEIKKWIDADTLRPGNSFGWPLGKRRAA